MFKKMLILASMALAVVAIAAPASASAARWVHWTTFEVEGETHETHTTVEEITEDFTGFMKFSWAGAEGNNFGCVVHAHVNGTTVGGQAQAEVTGFEITTGTCKGNGVFAGCELESHSTTVPWSMDVSTTDFLITNFSMSHAFKNCLVAPSQWSFPEITAVPDEATKINCLTVSGSGLEVSTLLKASGTLCAYSESTYGIE